MTRAHMFPKRIDSKVPCCTASQVDESLFSRQSRQPEPASKWPFSVRLPTLAATLPVLLQHRHPPFQFVGVGGLLTSAKATSTTCPCPVSPCAALRPAIVMGHGRSCLSEAGKRCSSARHIRAGSLCLFGSTHDDHFHRPTGQRSAA